MKKLSIIIKGTAFSVVTFAVLSSCMVRKEYERPAAAVDEKLFRTDMLPQDSTSIANVSWKEIFTDPILQGHITKALENNLDVRIAVQNITSAEAYLKQAKAAYEPTLSIGPNYTFQTQSINTQFGQIIGERRYVNQFDITATIGWEADLWGKMKSQQKAQLATYLGTLAAHKAVKSDLVASIASAYFQLLTYDDQKRIIEETIKVRENNLETTKALKEAGTLTEVAVQQSEALVYNAKSLLIDIDTQIQLLENTVSMLMGEPSQTIARSSLRSQSLPESLALGYPASLLSNRPDVMQAEFNLMNAFELTNVAKAQFYPTLKLTGSGGVQSVDIDHLFSVNSLFANVVAGLAQPILNRRQIKTNYDVSLANKETAYLNFRKSILMAGKEVSDAIRVFSVQDSFIDLKKKELDSYKKSVDYSQELVNYGMANYLEVLNASVNSLNAELNISNAEYSKMKAAVDLYQALGGGWK
ncbi:efflux transporter outer membrane subunit [Chryseobacterium indoltheticum]|uniref:Efflux transporter, outer membrane factor (OMF) lipoprotein, NodT family n=1 Tax=Chryseobacterium indoltheticum TaxID=254 RepID=A0A381FFL8_9FLAO|nr:efflux transporter outer membrane subunit [Chryseobacterium indoltheticum]AZA74421.1 efflux transporter outer membrane subunit [Chryseobacterium indoltheticum]MDF2832214.1 efflux transporter outer rane subunit [Chryseobacterium indoltheticum]SIQ05012.1 efflux transporter, outer membrane factor (OMF) lipoprotein, NodT family [Chryseobacterium indoltheticum]SUX45339.1 Outer membrane protein oprM precursor [Chryseobacterium indoltheticum]